MYYFSCILGHTEEKKMAATLSQLTAVFKPFGRNRWMRNIINDGVGAVARKSQPPRFQSNSSLIHGRASDET